MEYKCTKCGGRFLKWSGKCPNCGVWDTLEEVSSDGGDVFTTRNSSSAKNAVNHKIALSKVYTVKEASKSQTGKKLSTGFSEFDRVLGGGFVAGETVLMSGEPGIGKSTLLLQIALKISRKQKVLYISGEEAVSQIAMRIKRVEGSNDGDGGSVKGGGVISNNIGDDNNDRSVASGSKVSKGTRSPKGTVYGTANNLLLVADTKVEKIIQTIASEKPALVILDSIQAVTSVRSDSYVGSTTQVRICGGLMIETAKKHNIPIVMVGQVTKTGRIAGPKILEHAVDCVLHIEGDEFNVFRIVRSSKNRYGTTNEIGVFEMRDIGMVEVANPSKVFLDDGGEGAGQAVGAVLQGSRVVFVEVQALTVKSMVEGSPLRRVANGVEKRRLDMLCAVLSRRGDVFLGDKDVFVNVVGGLKVREPSLDLAICAAIKSAVNDVVLSRDNLFVGEVGLTGEVRSLWGVSSIVSEALRMGFKSVFLADTKGESLDKKMQRKTIVLKWVRDLLTDD